MALFQRKQETLPPPTPLLDRLASAEAEMQEWSQLSEQARLASLEAEGKRKLLESVHTDATAILNYTDQQIEAIKVEARGALRQAGEARQALQQFEQANGDYATLTDRLDKLLAEQHRENQRKFRLGGHLKSGQ